MGARKDITGLRVGKLTAVSSTGEKCKNGDYRWNCVCDCGNQRQVSLGNFQSKPWLACSPCTKEQVKIKKGYHGFNQKHKTYKAWCKIKERCLNRNSKDYPDYGGAGITIHDAFKKDFLAFYKELGEAPEGKGWSVDRIDCSRGYEPGNIRWADHFQQARNKLKSRANSSGATGVHWDNKFQKSTGVSSLYAVAQWNEYEDGQLIHKKKSFPVKVFGLLEAFSLACKHRELKILELNAKGYGYSQSHGKERIKHD